MFDFYVFNFLNIFPKLNNFKKMQSIYKTINKKKHSKVYYKFQINDDLSIPYKLKVLKISVPK